MDGIIPVGTLAKKSDVDVSNGVSGITIVSMVISQSRSIKQGVWRGESILSDLLLSKTLEVHASLGPTSGSAHGSISVLDRFDCLPDD